MQGVVFAGDGEVEMCALPNPRPGQSLLYLGLQATIGAGSGAPESAHSENEMRRTTGARLWTSLRRIGYYSVIGQPRRVARLA